MPQPRKPGTWHSRNREKALADMGEYHRETRKFKRYGITKEQYEAMLEAQSGGCALCGRPEELRTADRRRGLRRGLLCIDHDHETGKVRGVLCDDCNRGLGAFKDDEALLIRAIAYLREA